MCIDFFLGVARNIGSKIICIMYRYKSGAKEGWRIGGESRMNDSDENTAWKFVSSLAQLYESRANEDGIMNPNEQRQAPSRWATEGGLIGIRIKG